MAVSPKPSVFKTGPNDSLRVVDVYSPGTVAEVVASVDAANYGVQSGALMAAEAAAAIAAAIQTLRQNLQKDKGSDIALEKLLSLGITPGQLASFIGVSLPANVAIGAVLQALALRDGLGVNALNGALGLLNTTLYGPTLKGLSTPQLTAHVSAILDVLEAYNKGQMGGGEKLARLGITKADPLSLALDALVKLGPNDPAVKTLADIARLAAQTRMDLAVKETHEIIDDIDESDLTPAEKAHVKKGVALQAADDGNYSGAADVIESMGRYATPALRRETVTRAMKGFRLDEGVPIDEYGAEGADVIANLDRIEEEALLYRRGDEWIVDYTMLRYASEDLIDTLRETPPFDQAAAIIGDIDTNSKTAYLVIRETYPHVVVN